MLRRGRVAPRSRARGDDLEVFGGHHHTTATTAIVLGDQRLEVGGERELPALVEGRECLERRTAALPRVLHVRRRDAAPSIDTLDHFMACALAESQTPRAGGEVVLARLSELMFVEVVRRFVATLPSAQLGWLAGLRDEQIGRALGALHARSAHPWTLEELAREVGSSRSVLAERFAEYVGVPPMQYLAQWRMQLAATMLSGPATLSKIAEDVGYGSEAALSRAFKKIVGVAPATWRATRNA